MNKFSAFDLSGKTALVTGCDKGIGRAMAVALSLAGADIIAFPDPSNSRAAKLQMMLNRLATGFRHTRLTSPTGQVYTPLSIN